MTLKEHLAADMKTAMKNQESVRKIVISTARAAILQVEKDEQRTLDDSGVIAVIAKEIKMRKEVMPEFEKANRSDLVEKNKQEIEYLQMYMPSPLTEEALRQLVQETIAGCGAKTLKDMGMVMGKLLPLTAGRADGKTVNQLVRQILQG